jgi:hypothetical protein
MGTLLLVLDLVGTFVFALSGAAAGVKNRLYLLGVLVLSFAAGNAGGIARDLLIGPVPPAGISDWRYVAVRCSPESSPSGGPPSSTGCAARFSFSTPWGWGSSRLPVRKRRWPLGSTRSWRRSSAC